MSHLQCAHVLRSSTGDLRPPVANQPARLEPAGLAARPRSRALHARAIAQCHPGSHGVDGRTPAPVHRSWQALRRSPRGRPAIFHGGKRAGSDGVWSAGARRLYLCIRLQRVVAPRYTRRAAFAAAAACATATLRGGLRALPARGHRRDRGVSGSKEERSEYEFVEWIESLREGPIVVDELRDEVDEWLVWLDRRFDRRTANDRLQEILA